MNKFKQLLISSLLILIAFNVQALPIIGEIGMGGNFIAVDNSWSATSIGSATGIDFNPNLFIVNSATGSFSGIGAIGNIKDLQFDSFVGPIVDFWSIDGFSFELTSIVKLATSSATFLDLDGTGIISGNGFDATIGAWSLTGDNAGGTFTWSAGTRTAVPEPAMLALMGIGLMGFAVGRRKV